MEVALGVGALFAGGMAWHIVRPTPDQQTRAADEDRYLVASITVPRPAAGGSDESGGLEAHRVRIAAVHEELTRRLASEPRIRRWAFSDEPPGPWIEIVGVVPNIEASADRVFFDGTPVVYLPATPGTLDPMTLIIDVGADPAAFTPRLRSILAEADPSAILDYAHPLDELPADELTAARIAIGLITSLSLIAIVLSTAALYALMSLTVAQRTREIGIRIALGGNARRIVGTVARRGLTQLALGVALGSGFWVAVFSAMLGGSAGGEMEPVLAAWPWMLLAAVGVVVAVGLTACLRPTLKGIRIRPMEALRADG